MRCRIKHPDNDLLATCRDLIRERVCTVCMEALPGGKCGLPSDRQCPLITRLPQILGIIASTHEKKIDPYLEKIRQLICANCSEMVDGTCPHFSDAGCALDRYVPWIIELLGEAICQHRQKKQQLARPASTAAKKQESTPPTPNNAIPHIDKDANGTSERADGTGQEDEAEGDYDLPRLDSYGFCNVLMCALGGDGANMAAKLLFKTGCTHFNLNGGYDAKYGSEKKGTATDVCVRFCNIGTPVRQSGPTTTPHFLVIFHENLIKPLQLGQGLEPKAVCVVNSDETPAAMREALQLHNGKIVCVNATRIAHECGSRLNMPLLAVLCHELSFPDKTIRRIIARQWPKASEANLAAFDKALSQSKSSEFPANDRFPRRAMTLKRGPIGWRNMLNGGSIDALTHSTARRDNRIAGGGIVPEFNPELCNSCGICLTVCSDPGGLLWQDGRMVGIDDRFCKGCMRCVEVCPTTKKGHALSSAQMMET